MVALDMEDDFEREFADELQLAQEEGKPTSPPDFTLTTYLRLFFFIFTHL